MCLAVHWKDWCWRWNSNTLATWCEELTHLKRPLWWERLRAGKERDDRRWDGWMASPTQWTWVWVDSGSWWWTGRPDMLRFMGWQRVGHDWATELNWYVLRIFPKKDINPITDFTPWGSFLFIFPSILISIFMKATLPVHLNKFCWLIFLIKLSPMKHKIKIKKILIPKILTNINKITNANYVLWVKVVYFCYLVLYKFASSKNMSARLC